MLKRFIVLDLDETLICSQYDPEGYANLRLSTSAENSDIRHRVHCFKIVDAINLPGTGEISKVCTIVRPGAKEMINYLQENYDVIIWTAGTLRYALTVVSRLFDHPPSLILTRNDCIIDGKIVRKPLVKVWDYFEDADPTNTLIIDDNRYVFQHSGQSCVLVSKFKVPVDADCIRNDDDVCNTLLRWFKTKEFKTAKDIRDVTKPNFVGVSGYL